MRVLAAFNNRSRLLLKSVEWYVPVVQRGVELRRVDVSETEAIPGLDGERRQQVAAELWRAWRDEGRGALILTGFSGVGKTEHVVRPLVARAKSAGSPAIHIDIPLHATDLDQELFGLLVQELYDSGAEALADAITTQPNLSSALRYLLRQGGLVVIDEFQRLLDRSVSRPIEPVATTFQGIARRTPDGGCLWLVLNRAIDPTWTEPFYARLLEPPTELADLQRIVLSSIATGDAEERFPAGRRLESSGASARTLAFCGCLAICCGSMRWRSCSGRRAIRPRRRFEDRLPLTCLTVVRGLVREAYGYPSD